MVRRNGDAVLFTAVNELRQEGKRGAEEPQLIGTASAGAGQQLDCGCRRRTDPENARDSRRCSCAKAGEEHGCGSSCPAGNSGRNSYYGPASGFVIEPLLGAGTAL